MRNKGITLIELLVVVAVVGILAVALGFSYVGWQGRYRVEKVTKDLYTDLMDARTRALTQSRTYFVDFNTPAPPAGQGCYRVIEDTNGDGALNNGDTIVIPPPPTVLPLTNQKTVEYALDENITGTTVRFNTRGVTTNLGSINFTLPPDVDPDYDCIVISQMRINIGKWDGADCNAK
jgi:prepilin-type N-terminal cleavage/methylation domain-containing protein